MQKKNLLEISICKATLDVIQRKIFQEQFSLSFIKLLNLYCFIFDIIYCHQMKVDNKNELKTWYMLNIFYMINVGTAIDSYYSILWIVLFFVFLLSIPDCLSIYMTTLSTLLTEPRCWVSGEWPGFVQNPEPPPPPAWAPHRPPIPRLVSQSAWVYGMWLQEPGQIRPFR